ncbi:hypothetical protein PilKf_02329 [Pillotina sp. SPG140]|jgi:flavodoxin
MILVIYCSYSGNCACIAEHIKEQTGADLLRLTIAGEKPRAGFLRYVWAGPLLLSKKNPPLEPYTVDIQRYDLIIIGTPVWAGSMAPVFRTFFSQTPISGKRIAFFCCHAGSRGSVFNAMKDALPGNEYSGEIDFVHPISQAQTGLFNTRLKPWLNSVQSSPSSGTSPGNCT